MKRSETISALTEALAKAQGAFPAVQKSGENKHLGNQYSTLDDIIAAVRKPLAANGLSFLQPLVSLDDGALVLETILMHQTGEWVGSEVAVPSLSGNRAVNELQAFGSALTYMRRYTLTAMLGVTSEEDVDGNGASGNGQKPPAKQAAKPQQQKAAPKQAPKQQSATPMAPTPEQAPAAEWDALTPPADFTELWGAHRFAELGYESMQHAKNAIAKVYPGEKLGTGDDEIRVDRAWQALIDYAKSKETQGAG